MHLATHCITTRRDLRVGGSAGPRRGHFAAADKATLDRIALVDERLGAYAFVAPEEARWPRRPRSDERRKADATRGPLDGSCWPSRTSATSVDGARRPGWPCGQGRSRPAPRQSSNGSTRQVRSSSARCDRRRIHRAHPVPRSAESLGRGPLGRRVVERQQRRSRGRTVLWRTGFRYRRGRYMPSASNWSHWPGKPTWGRVSRAVWSSSPRRWTTWARSAVRPATRS